MLDTAAGTKIQNVLSALNRALANRHIDDALSLFVDDCYWRDFLAFTWNLKTVEGKARIRDMLDARLDDVQPGDWTVDDNEPATHADGITEGFIEFDTSLARGYGYIRLKDGLIWTLLTTMHELKGHEEPRGDTRPMGAKHGAHQGEPTWAEEREAELAELGVSTQPYVLIIGGGQGGIALGARLRQHGVPALIVEKNARPGDSWRQRYKSLCLHDPVWYDHLPYIKFPENWPVFAPKDKIGDWLEMYAKVMELNFWGATECKQARYDEASQTWTVVVERDGREITLQPKQLVLATGMSAKANVPSFPGQERFAGIQQHSSEHPGPDGMAGKRVVVIGSNNSAHDICAALAENDVDVTMVQRSSTHISRSESLMKHALGPLYSEEALANGITTEKADLLFASIPYALLADFQKPAFDTIREEDAEFYQQLEDAGFMLDFGPDDSGLFMKYLRRASGYYIDVGASQLIIDGRIKLASGSRVKALTEHSVVLEDGRELPADVVIYATGYGSMNGWAADLISQDVADTVGKVWGLGSDTPKDPGPWEGEQRNMWKPTQQNGLWFHGGNLAQSRHYSHYLALQLKARMEGIPTPVYGLQESHHQY
ncbi:NAD(P)/FAD-dependent oxidoreductase [Salinisphaera sp. Q1T1-3]|uniref:NAD(P)/FAD-dependent oxidoreductase n=1 Tax=Salinisphaera sp. Q1T1-3 TaxID=2321229 RepID=UPI000E7263C7|nr:NAD(P)/FAD-dependent oxidoreductase [Salinisphaera sp. Q1T1-3]RJS93014.1 NAD(P)/FAD-dependent oxidoreductase [Salinisphaera sp. Q1T1-3]